MEKIGVEAIVAGLSSFLGDMGKVDKSISGLSGSSSLLGRAFSGLGSIVEWLTGSVFRVLEYTLGSLLSSAIQGVISYVQELISSTIEAGNEFQSLEIRLNNFNFDKATESAKGYEAAQAEAVKVTREQLEWLQKIAASTPYDLTDIANVYTLARSYGFANDEAQSLTTQITDFAASMGLGNTEITRIIKNFGQMTQLGKVTQRELNDLAVGAFVPVNDVLEIMRKETGLAGDEFDDFRNSTEGVNSFMNAFAQLVEQRAAGAAEKMARTFKGATDNAKDFIKSLFGLNVVKPILDVIGSRIADFVASFTASPKWEQVVAATVRIGESLSGIVDKLLNLGGSAEDASNAFLSAIEGVADWLEANDDNIIQWVKDLEVWITEKAIPAVKDFWDTMFGKGEDVGLLKTVSDWLINDMVPAIKQAADWIGNVLVPHVQNDLVPAFLALLPLGTAVKDLLFAVLGQKPNQDLSTWIHESLIPGIESLTNFINLNRDAIATWIQFFIKMSIILSVIGFIGGLIAKLIVFVATIAFTIASIVSFISTWGVVITVIAGVIGWFKVLEFGFRSLVGAVQIFAQQAVIWFNFFKANIINTVNSALSAIRSGDWAGAGAAIVQGMVRGVVNNAHFLIETLRRLAQNALAAAKSTLGIKSPSTEFFEIGEQLMQGFANGITATAGLAAKAMQGAANQTMSIGAMAPGRLASAMAPGTVSNVQTNNYNLQVNTSAPSEPILQDFSMLESLAA